MEPDQERLSALAVFVLNQDLGPLPQILEYLRFRGAGFIASAQRTVEGIPLGKQWVNRSLKAFNKKEEVAL